MSGIKSSSFHGKMKPRGVPNPTRRAIPVNSPLPTLGNSPPATNATSQLPVTTGKPSSPSTTNSTGRSISVSYDMVYSRRYLDWNRLTFAFHAMRSQDQTFDSYNGRKVSNEITDARKTLNLTTLYGCAPKTYCQYCRPFGADGNIYNLLEIALGLTVINQERANIPRIIIINTGTIRFDLVQGPFTL